jgi:hypothetical protein
MTYMMGRPTSTFLGFVKIGMTPIGSKPDALAALDLISEEAKKQEPDLIVEMTLALQKYVDALESY